MILLLGAAAANLMALPTVQNKVTKPSFKAEMNEGGAAAVRLRIVVSSTGTVVDCDPSFVNGPPSNAQALCSMLQTNTQFAAARDAEGRPTYGVIHQWNHWHKGRWKGAAVPSWNPVDLALATNRVPKGAREGALYQLALQVDASGKVESCAASARLDSQVRQLLCREASSGLIRPAVDERGQPVPSVQEFTVRLTSQRAIDKIVKRLRGQ